METTANGGGVGASILNWMYSAPGAAWANVQWAAGGCANAVMRAYHWVMSGGGWLSTPLGSRSVQMEVGVALVKGSGDLGKAISALLDDKTTVAEVPQILERMKAALLENPEFVKSTNDCSGCLLVQLRDYVRKLTGITDSEKRTMVAGWLKQLLQEHPELLKSFRSRPELVKLLEELAASENQGTVLRARDALARVSLTTFDPKEMQKDAKSISVFLALSNAGFDVSAPDASTVSEALEFMDACSDDNGVILTKECVYQWVGLIVQERQLRLGEKEFKILDAFLSRYGDLLSAELQQSLGEVLLRYVKGLEKGMRSLLFGNGAITVFHQMLSRLPEFKPTKEMLQGWIKVMQDENRLQFLGQLSSRHLEEAGLLQEVMNFLKGKIQGIKDDAQDVASRSNYSIIVPAMAQLYASCFRDIPDGKRPEWVVNEFQEFKKTLLQVALRYASNPNSESNFKSPVVLRLLGDASIAKIFEFTEEERTSLRSSMNSVITSDNPRNHAVALVCLSGMAKAYPDQASWIVSMFRQYFEAMKTNPNVKLEPKVFVPMLLELLNQLQDLSLLTEIVAQSVIDYCVGTKKQKAGMELSLSDRKLLLTFCSRLVEMPTLSKGLRQSAFEQLTLVPKENTPRLLGVKKWKELPSGDREQVLAMNADALLEVTLDTIKTVLHMDREAMLTAWHLGLNGYPEVLKMYGNKFNWGIVSLIDGLLSMEDLNERSIVMLCYVASRLTDDQIVAVEKKLDDVAAKEISSLKRAHILALRAALMFKFVPQQVQV